MKIFRSYSKDKRCEPLKFLPKNSTVKRAALVSFPGSGSTWLRHMLEQTTGIYSGSVYGSKRLRRAGKLSIKIFSGLENFLKQNDCLFVLLLLLICSNLALNKHKSNSTYSSFGLLEDLVYCKNGIYLAEINACISLNYLKAQ